MASHAAKALLYDPPEVNDLVQVFKGVRDWYTVGLKLDLDTGELDDIRSLSSKEQLSAMFRGWLDHCRDEEVRPSWVAVEKVLRELDIHKPLQEIRDRYSDRPTMKQLLCVHGRDQSAYRLIQTVSSTWDELAHHLDIPVGIIEQIDCDYSKVEDKCKNVMKQWIDGCGRKPVAWSTLMTVLEDLEKREFVKDFSENCLSLVP